MSNKSTSSTSPRRETSFVEHIRRGGISAPIHKGFSREAWTHAHRTYRKDEPCDALYWTGLSIHNALAVLRRRYESIVGQADVDAYVRALVGLGNLEQRILRRRTSERLQSREHGATLNDVVELKLDLDSGSAHNVEEIASVIVESLTKAIGERLREPRFDLHSDPMSTFEACRLDLNLCGTYRLLESLWQDCLWNGYALTEADDFPGVIASPVSTESRLDALWRVISEYRRETLRASRAAFASRQFARLDTGQIAQRLPHRLVVAVERHAEGHAFDFAGATEKRAAQAAEQALFALGEIADDYLGPLLDQPVAKLGNCSLRQLVAAWLVIGSISTAESESDAWPRIASNESLINFSQTYSVEEVTEAVAYALSIAVDTARRLVDFMIFDGNTRQTLWTHPLIRLPSGRLCLLAPSIEHAHSAYVLERWLRYLDFNVSKKGNPFEQQVRKRLATARRSDVLSQRFQVLRSAFMFHAGDREKEDIDLVAVIGKRVILGEIKCSITPTEPIDYFNNRSVITGAVAQIRRKSAFVERNRASFSKALAKRGVSIPDDFRLTRVVVVNNPIYVGRVVDDVPVVDLLVLERYVEGFFVETARVDKDGTLSADHTLGFYETVDEAEDHLERYLTGLPQLRLMLDTISERVTEIPVQALVRFPRIAYRTFEVKIDRTKMHELHAHERSKSATAADRKRSPE